MVNDAIYFLVHDSMRNMALCAQNSEHFWPKSDYV